MTTFFNNSETILQLLKEREYSTKPALIIENRNKTKISWNYLIRQSLTCAYSLLDLKGEKTLYSLPTVILCLDNCQESFFIFYAVHLAGLIPMVLSPKLPSEQIESIVNEHNVLACFIDNKQKYKFEFIQDPEIKKVIVGIKRTGSFGFMSYSQFIDEENQNVNNQEYDPEDISEEQRQLQEQKRLKINELIEERKETDVCEIVIVPAEDGTWKRIFWTHLNVMTQCDLLQRKFKLNAKDKYIHFLPNYFFIERIFAFYLSLYCQFTVHIGSSDLLTNKAVNLFHLMSKIKPTLFLGVPRVYEKIIHELKQHKGRRKRWAKKKVYETTVFNIENTKKKHCWRANNIQKKMKKKMGILSIKQFLNAISPISHTLMLELLSYGIVVSDGLCLPETTGYCSINRNGKYLIDTLGSSIDKDVIVTIEDNHICVEGAIVTHDVLHEEEDFEKNHEIDEDEQYIQTSNYKVITQYEGEIQIHNEVSYIKRTGTSLPLITTSTGQWVYPLSIEKQLNEMTTINSSIVIGENKKFLACILFTTMDSVRNELKDDTPSRHQISKDPFYANYLKKQLEQINEGLSKAIRLKRFVVVVDPKLNSLLDDMDMRQNVLQQYANYYSMIYN